MELKIVTALIIFVFFTVISALQMASDKRQDDPNHFSVGWWLGYMVATIVALFVF